MDLVLAPSDFLAHKIVVGEKPRAIAIKSTTPSSISAVPAASPEMKAA